MMNRLSLTLDRIFWRLFVPRRLDGRTFAGQRVFLDGKIITNCVFEDCDLYYFGGPLSIDEVKMTDCEVKLAGAAGRGVMANHLFAKAGLPWRGVYPE